MRIRRSVRTRVRAVLIAVMIVLPLQYGLVGLVGLMDAEPWPAVVLPGFKRVLDDGHRHTVRHVHGVVHFTDGSSERLATAELLADLPRSYHGGFFRVYVLPETPRTDALGPWFSDRIARLFPDRTPLRVEIVWEALSYEFGTAPEAAMLRPDDARSFDLLPAISYAP